MTLKGSPAKEKNSISRLSTPSDSVWELRIAPGGLQGLTNCDGASKIGEERDKSGGASVPSSPMIDRGGMVKKGSEYEWN
jgi:hypothetical protein